MSFLSGFKKTIKYLFNVRKWLDYQQLVKTSRSFSALLKETFVSQQATSEESFETALQRLKISEAGLAQRLKAFRCLMRVWIFLLVLCTAYSIHLLSEYALRGFFPCVGLLLIILTQVFRYHFWIFQIKHRRLGCTFLDWFNTYFFNREKREKKREKNSN